MRLHLGCLFFITNTKLDCYSRAELGRLFGDKIGDPLGCLLVFPYPVVKVNGKLQRPKDYYFIPSGMKGPVTQPVWNQNQFWCSSEGRGDTDKQ